MKIKTQNLKQFCGALFHHWWLLSFSVLSVIATAATYLPGVHLPKLLPLEVALILILAASYLAYSDQCSVIESLGKEKADIENKLTKARQHAASLRDDLGLTNGAISDLQKDKDDLTAEKQRLLAEIERLSIKPYDAQKFARVRQMVADLRFYERDLLRLILLTGETRSDVIFLARTNQSIGFDLNICTRSLQENGLVQRKEDRLNGYATFSVNSTAVEVLTDVLFPRDEGGIAPFFKGV